MITQELLEKEITHAHDYMKQIKEIPGSSFNKCFKEVKWLKKNASKSAIEDTNQKHDRKIIRPLELDFYIHDLKLAFEYDGEQHYDRKVCEEVFKSDFDEQRKRDIKKNALCRHKKINLIRIKYDEKLNLRNIKKIISNREVKIL